MMNMKSLRLFGLRKHFLVALVMAIIWVTPLSAVGAETISAKKFQLYATDGYMTLPDGKQLYIWGYSLKDEPGSATVPAPTLEVNEGDRVEITLTNIGPKKTGIKQLAHTIHFHGLDTDQLNDGVPHTSVAIQVGESFNYQFIAKKAGTYFYHCHVDTIEHLQMGMYGAFIVKAKNGINQAWTGGPSYDKDYVFLLNEIDPLWHQAVEEGKSYDRTDFHPRYWTINGKAYPDTEKDPTSFIEGKVGETVLIRIINSGYESHSFHMHGYHFQVIASDGRPLPEPLTKDTVLIGPGERYDLLVTFDQSGMFPFHSHNIVDNTNNGTYPGGLHTMIDVTENKADRSPMIMTIRLKTGRNSVTVNSESIQLANSPVAINGTTYVPFRFIGENLGAAVKWLPKEKSVIYTKDQTTIQLWLNLKQAKVNGRLISLPTPPKEIKGSVMVPLRFVANQLEAKLDKDSKTGEIIVTGKMSVASEPSQHSHDVGNSGDGATNNGTLGNGNNSAGTIDPGTSADLLTIDITTSFMPTKLTIKKGQTVKWVNKDTQIHTVYDLQDKFKSPNILPAGQFSYTFIETGTYTYYCSVHPSMVGEIIVTE
ncbi:MAG: stalk domain-containing protein [Candidatus Cohnella colombiensis]|uniref:Stalk domain-containing protein n=1 Tax=Candidatus Cohnella colombiensis TaxID=3121368 RepID=A0AA95EVA2_9BACL|nr:MAG: stalk domain-containing protein [Cohnella sp.]